MRRVVCLISAVITMLAVTPASAAPRKYTIGADVEGAVTARFTLRKPVRFLLDMRESRPSDLYGMTLTRIDNPTSFFIGMKVAPIKIGGFGGIGPVADGLTWRPGTYDLTLFSTTRARVSLSFEKPMPKMRFRTRALQLVRRGTTSTDPVWSDQVDLTITGAPHGLVVFQRHEWNGLRRQMHDSCVWQTVPCLPVDDQQLIGGKNETGSHLAESFSARTGTGLKQGSNHISLASITAGSATRRTAVVLVVP